MPWHKENDNPECDGVAVVKDDDGAVAGCHETEAEADDQLAALYASEETEGKAAEPEHELTAGNTLKAIAKTDDELRVANYIVLFNGRDLEGLASPRINNDGSRGEYFTPDTQLESEYTKSGQVPVDWEHGNDPDPEAPTRNDVLGYVDWKTAVVDKLGIWVERVLDRRNRYIKYLEQLIEAGLIGNSSEAIPGQVEKAADGQIKRWPLARDTLTVTPMEPRMITQNALSALKALGVVWPESNNESENSDNANRIAIAKAKAQLRILEL